MAISYLHALTIPVSAAALLYARWEYRTRGRLTLFGLFLLCVMLFVPNLVIHYAISWELPKTMIGYLGAFIAVIGISLCLTGIIFFRSIPKTLCLDTGQLTNKGPYRWSRNPQYVGWVLFLLGFALTDWSAWCFGALLAVTVSLHVLVLVEEEHLRRVFGKTYLDYCSRVPRYLVSGRYLF